MQDNKGVYYYPYPDNKKTRMYIKKSQGVIWWSREIPELWEEHGWIPYDAILKASAMYKNKGPGNFDPRSAYDIEVAKTLLDDKGPSTQ